MKGIDEEEKKVHGVQCGEMTPFTIYPSGENVTCHVKIVNERNQWNPAEEQKVICFCIVYCAMIALRATYLKVSEENLNCVGCGAQKLKAANPATQLIILLVLDFWQKYLESLAQ